MKKIWRFFKKFVFWTFFVLLFLFTTLTVLLYVYEDDIKQIAIDSINKHLKTDIKVQRIELSVFNDFPRASLEFRNVLIQDAFEDQQSSDTLLFSNRVFCSFNVWDIWNGDYNVNRIALKGGQLNLRTTKSGDVNYDIVKESKDTSESNFKFSLELLRIDEMDFTYSNLATGQYYKLDVEKSLVKGDFTAENFDLISESQLVIKKIKSNSVTLIRNKPAQIDLNLSANTLEQSYHISKADILIGQMPFELFGYLKDDYVDLSFSGKEIELADLANSLRGGTSADAGHFNGSGILNFNSKISGEISKTTMPSITAHFDVSDGTLTNPSNKLQIRDIYLEGDYQNEQEDRIELLAFNTFKLKLLESYFEGSGDVQNFTEPKINTRLKGNLNLQSFHQFFNFQGIQKIGGIIQLNLDLAIQFHDPQYRKEKFSLSKSKGNLTFQNVHFKNGVDNISYEHINGEVVVSNDDAAVKDFSVKTVRSDFVLNGALTNLPSYLSNQGELGVIASLESSKIDLNEFIGESNDHESSAPPEKFILPNDLNLNLDLDVNELIWDQHTFQSLKGKLLLIDRKATASNLSLNTLGGTVKGWIILNNLVDAGNMIESQLNFQGVDVKALFTEWKNFDQESITDQHISGTGSGNVDLLLFFNPYFSIIEEKIYTLAAIQIEKGELNELETMKLITDYMRSNNALKLMLNKHIDQFEEKLMHLKFSTLSNTIEIKDRKIFIPKMLIASNALNVELFGWHDFDNNVEYHFSFRFRDLKTIPEYTEFGKVEDDGLGIVIYLTMTGPLDNPSFSLDKEERKNNVKENIQEEKQTVKSILKTEFGIFKNDSTVQTINPDKQKQVEFIFYDEDSEVSDTVETKNKNKGRTGKLFQKLKENSEKEKDESVDEFDE
jgi:hypothetical protein